MTIAADRETWKLTMDWLCTGEYGMPEEPEKRARIVSAAERDPDVAQVDAWRAMAEPLPDWALAVDAETPHWGVEICNAVWLDYLDRQLRNIGNERWHAADGWCGGEPLSRRQWASWAIAALGAWLDDNDEADNPLSAEIHALLGQRDDDKAGAVRLLKETLELAISTPPAKFQAGFEALTPTTKLAVSMRDRVKYLQFRCGYRWEQIVLEICRAIGDEAYRDGEPRFWHVGACNGQIAFVKRDAPLHIPSTAGVLVGLWAWLRGVSPDDVELAYPDVAAIAERTRIQLGEMTPVKRWLAGRLFVGVRIWLQEYDRQNQISVSPALAPYPSLSESRTQTA